MQMLLKSTKMSSARRPSLTSLSQPQTRTRLLRRLLKSWKKSMRSSTAVQTFQVSKPLPVTTHGKRIRLLNSGLTTVRQGLNKLMPYPQSMRARSMFGGQWKSSNTTTRNSSSRSWWSPLARSSLLRGFLSYSSKRTLRSSVSASINAKKGKP